MKNIKTTLLGLLLLVGIVAAPLATVNVASAAGKADACEGIAAIGGGNACNNNAAGDALPAFIKDIINILLFLIGAIAVIMIIIGGIRYVTSNGDQGQVTGAKNTILYAIVGLVVAIMAYAIVNFVVSRL